MKMTRSTTKDFCLSLESDLEHIIIRKKSGERRPTAAARTARVKKPVNNPWGNRGRKKCSACRLRKRGCAFDSEDSACGFCAVQGIRCGAKVLAEKARYFIAKPGELIHADTDDRNMSCHNSSLSIPATDENMTSSVEDDFTASSSIDYIPPSQLDLQLGTSEAVAVEVTRFEIKGDGFNISSPTSYNSNQSYISPSSDCQPSYFVASNTDSSEEELLFLYIDSYDDEILDYQSQYTSGEPLTLSPTLHCIQRYA